MRVYVCGTPYFLCLSANLLKEKSNVCVCVCVCVSVSVSVSVGVSVSVSVSMSLPVSVSVSTLTPQGNHDPQETPDTSREW